MGQFLLQSLLSKCLKDFGAGCDQFYGYLYTAHHHVLIRVVNDKTMWLDEMVLPPFSYDVDDE